MSEVRGQWYFNSGPDPFANDESAQWTAYSNEDNEVIEEKYLAHAPKVELQNYVIHFEILTQISKKDHNRQRAVKREMC